MFRGSVNHSTLHTSVQGAWRTLSMNLVSFGFFIKGALLLSQLQVSILKASWGGLTLNHSDVGMAVWRFANQNTPEWKLCFRFPHFFESSVLYLFRFSHSPTKQGSAFTGIGCTVFLMEYVMLHIDPSDFLACGVLLHKHVLVDRTYAVAMLNQTCVFAACCIFGKTLLSFVCFSCYCMSMP